MQSPKQGIHRVLKTLVAGIALVLVLMLVLGGTRAAFAQDSGDSRSLLEMPRARQGYWFGFGAYGIASNLIEEGHNHGIYSGYGFSLRIGQLITERLGLGLLYEDGGYMLGKIAKGNDKGGVGGLLLEGTATLWRNLSVHGGFGIGYVFVSDKTALDTSTRGGGGSYIGLGASYDLFPWRKRLTGGWAITPTVDFRIMPDGNIHAFTLFAGLQILRWSGLSDNMLILPEE
jgi:hypothetical protein